MIEKHAAPKVSCFFLFMSIEYRVESIEYQVSRHKWCKRVNYAKGFEDQERLCHNIFLKPATRIQLIRVRIVNIAPLHTLGDEYTC